MDSDLERKYLRLSLEKEFSLKREMHGNIRESSSENNSFEHATKIWANSKNMLIT
jgi:hypothetical protein